MSTSPANVADPVRRRGVLERRGSILLETGKVLSNTAFDGAQQIMRIAVEEIPTLAQPGSFVHLRCDDALPMRRPMSIMRVSPTEGWLDMLFKVHGQGTARLAERKPGDSISVLGPIGVPFRLSGYRKRPLLLGGGVGMPPMVYLAEHMRARAPEVSPLVLLASEVPFPFRARPSQIMVPGMPGAAIAAMPLLEDWGIASRLASRQGFPGCHDGLITELAREWLHNVGPTVVSDVELFACGPTPMLRAVQALAAEFDLPCQLSLEEYMACAVGGCAGCVVEVRTPQGPAMKRVCVDGPIFEAADVVI
ncbi:MAG: dihydroorotate dehydrogenase electron transfer subunit [Gammaproteobacteria bacterium]|nr:dihydroorotate dehydrogenase electron transfer subunit [Gammaproteobacteria bacterium]